MEEWSPIETAPKDGTQILAYARGFAGQKFYGVAEWALNGPGKIQPHQEGWFWAFAIRPTHWVPLPAPPTISET
jgi:hypothetical protein